jgi:hypothetical protein
LAGEHESGSVSAGKPGKKGREVLAPPPLRIGYSFHGLRKLIGLYRTRLVMLPPHLEQFRDALATGIVGLEHLDALNGVPTPEVEQRIATPFRPSLETAKGLTPRKQRCVLATPAPDGQTRDQKFRPLAFNLVKKT